MIGVGIVGAGFWSRLVQIPSFQAIPGWDLVGIASGRKERALEAAREFGIRKAYDDYEQLIDDPEVQVVDIVTPNYLHREIAVRALEAGKDVICIKPLAHTLRDAEAIVEAAEHNGRQVFYAENVNFTPVLNRFKALIGDGSYGDVFRFKSMHGVGGPHAPWFFDPELSGGGCIIDMAVHGLAFLDWFSDKAEVRSVYTEAATFVHTAHTVEDTSVIQLRFDDDRMGQTEDSWSTPGGYDGRYEAFGTRGHGFVDLLYGHPIRSITGGNEEGGSSGLAFEAVDEHFVKDGHLGMMQHFLDVLEQAIPSRSTAIDGLRIMQLVDAAYNSVRSGKPSRVTLARTK